MRSASFRGTYSPTEDAEVRHFCDTVVGVNVRRFVSMVVPLSLSLSLSVCLSVCLTDCLGLSGWLASGVFVCSDVGQPVGKVVYTAYHPVCVAHHVFFYPCVCLFVRPSVSPSVRLSPSRSVCLSVYSSVYLSVRLLSCLSFYSYTPLSVNVVCLAIF